MHRATTSAVLTILLAAGLGAGASRAAAKDTPAKGDVAAARRLFETNLDAIRKKDRAAYLACYLDAETLARTGPEGPRLGYAAHAAQSEKDPWPDVFDARDLQLVGVAPGVVYGTYRYRVRYGPDEEHSGISERLFLSTKAGWKIAMTSAFDAAPGTPPPPLAVKGATLIDGTGGAPVRDAVVVIRGGRIDCAGTSAACPVPDGVEVMDAGGLWILPGLVDAHVHFSQTGWADGRPDSLDMRATHPYEAVEAEQRANPDRYYRSYLCSGVTAVFDVGGYPWTWGLRATSETSTRAPHVEAAGPLLTTLDHWLNLPAERQFIYLKDESAAREGVGYLAAQRTSAVKVWFINNPDRPFEEMEAAVAAAGAEAKKRKLPLLVHSTGLREAKAALRAGASLLVHSVWDLPLDAEFLSLAKSNGTIYCPTLTVVFGYTRMYEAATSGRPPVVDDPGGCVDAGTLAKVAESATAGADKVNAARMRTPEQVEKMRATMAANLKEAQDAGIPIAMGTDAGNPLTLHGPSVYAEMEAMEAAGLTPMQVIVASTRGGAAAMGRSADFGTVEKGKAADLILVGADPLASVKNLRGLRWVIRGGALRPAEELRAARP
jgi:imidazolonepropionase-like amidohydrolase